MEYKTRYLYSPQGNNFYEVAELHLYEAAGTLPIDLVEVADSVFEEFTQLAPPPGKTRVSGPDGLPVWADSPPPSDAEVRARNEALRAYLMKTASERIAPLADAVDLELATDAEKAALRAWRLYRIELSRMDGQPGYPLAVEWPNSPDA